MLAIIVIIFEAVAVLFIGIFARTNDLTLLATSSSTLFGNTAALMLAFTLMYSPFRRLSLFALASLLIVIAVAAQTHLLFGTLWDSCFKGFSSSFNVDSNMVLRALMSSLAVLLTALDFVGLFAYWQVYLLLAPIMAIGYALNSAIIIYGLKAFDGGGGLTIFLYSGLCSLIIWAMCIRGKVDVNRYRIRESYVNQGVGFIGVVLAFINWPKFNVGGANISYINVNTTSVTSVAFLQSSAMGNTWAGLSAAILVSSLFASGESKQDKQKYKVFLDCFINGGIVIASFQDVSLDPVAAMVLAALSSILTLIIHKYFITRSDSDAESAFKGMMRNYAKIIYRILFPLLGIITASIVVAARNGKIPALLSSNYSQIAGFEMVGFIVVLAFGLIFGAFSGLAINIYLSYRAGTGEVANEGEAIDEHFLDGLHDEMHPLYYDIFDEVNKKEEENIDIANYTTRVIKESLLGARDNPLRVMSITKNVETKAEPAPAPKESKVGKDPKQSKMVIQKDYSKSGKGDVSKLKIPQRREEDEISEVRQSEGLPPRGKQLQVQKSNLKITESEMVPRGNKGVVRRLDYDDYGSEIRQDEVEGTLTRN